MYENRPDSVAPEKTPKAAANGRPNPAFSHGSNQNLARTIAGSRQNQQSSDGKKKYVNVEDEKAEFEKRKKEKERDYVNVNKEVDAFKKSRRAPNGGASNGAEPPPPSAHGGNKNPHGYINDPIARKTSPKPGAPTRAHQSRPKTAPRTTDWNAPVPVDEDEPEEDYVSHDPHQSRSNYYNDTGRGSSEGYYNVRN